MGALQARPAHRPYPGRRSAGHQPRPVGDRPGARGRIFQRLERGRGARTARSSWSATSSRRSSASRAPTRSEFERAARLGARHNRRRCARRDEDSDEPWSRARVPRPVDRRQLPLGAGGARRRRCGDRRGRLSATWACPTRRTRTARISTAGPGWSSCGSRSPSRTSDEGDEGEEGWLGEDARLYAGALAQQVRRWLDEAPVLASTKRPLSAGDILILVRSRGELASLIVARLFAEGVPVAGIDRLHLHKPLAVRDLLAAVASRCSRSTTSTSPICWSRR